jgi:hypothetical protein
LDFFGQLTRKLVPGFGKVTRHVKSGHFSRDTRTFLFFAENINIGMFPYVGHWFRDRRPPSLSRDIWPPTYAYFLESLRRADSNGVWHVVMATDFPDT